MIGIFLQEETRLKCGHNIPELFLVIQDNL